MATNPLPLPQEAPKAASASAVPQEQDPLPVHNKPFVVGGRGTTSGKDTTKLMIFIIVGIAVAALAFLALISTKGSQKNRAAADAAGKPNLGGKAPQAAAPGALVPQDNIATAQGENKTGNLEARDIERTRGMGQQNPPNPGFNGAALNSASPPALNTIASNAGTSSANAKTLGEIPPFRQPNYGDGTAGQYTPPPYTGGDPGPGVTATAGANQAASQSGRTDEQFSRPSMVFVAHEANGGAKPGVQLPVEPDNFGLQSGYHVAARLESMASTALHAPVTAVIEYNYQREGQVLIPAGARAVGHISQADASGIMNITFESLELPGGRTIPISAIGATTSLQALKGNVAGKHAGKSLAIRSLAGLGSTAAMMVGQSNVNGAISQGDLIRQRAADNIGTGADNEVANLQMTEHLVVSVPAGTEMYLIFIKSQRVAPGSQQNIAVGRTEP